VITFAFSGEEAMGQWHHLGQKDEFPAGLQALNTAPRSSELGRFAVGAPIGELRAFAGNDGLVLMCEPRDLEKVMQDVLPQISGIWVSTS
jgi:hypothetical protein